MRHVNKNIDRLTYDHKTMSRQNHVGRVIKIINLNKMIVHLPSNIIIYDVWLLKQSDNYH